MSLKDDFDKSFQENHKAPFPPELDIIAKGWMLIGAKWMAERCMNVAINITPCEAICHCASEAAEEIGQLAKELE